MPRKTYVILRSAAGDAGSASRRTHNLVAGGPLKAAVMIRPGSCYHEPERRIPGMGSARKYAVIDPAAGKLDRRIFSDQAIYDAEMEKIFGRAWLMIGHASLVPNNDDFFHTY